MRLCALSSRATLSKSRAQPILDRAAALAACVRGHHQRGDLLALSDLQADDRHLLDVLRTAVNFFELVDIDVVAAGIDDDFLGAPDDIQAPVVVEAPEVAGMQPSVAQNFGGRGLVAIVALPSRWARARRSRRSIAVAGIELDLDAVERLADRADSQRFVGPRDR